MSRRAPCVRAEERANDPQAPPEELWEDGCRTLLEYERYVSSNASVLERRYLLERSIVPHDVSFFIVEGYCAVCRAQTRLHVDKLYGEEGQPNWRERLVCSRCKLPNRVRAVYDYLESELQLSRDAKIYLTEQASPFYRMLLKRYSRLIGSEFLGRDVANGRKNFWRIRNEDLTALTFPNSSLDAIVTTDVLEHVPDTVAALSECFRCLRPGGSLIITVPFLALSQDTLVRARVLDDGRIHHELPPEYHGDPIKKRGALCYYHFGWDLLDRLRAAGFSDVRVRPYWSLRRGYLGGTQLLISAQK